VKGDKKDKDERVKDIGSGFKVQGSEGER